MDGLGERRPVALKAVGRAIEFGLNTFADVTTDDAGKPLSHARVIRDVVNEGVLADQVGIDFFGIGEHHRADYATSSPEIVAAAVAAQTKRIRVGSAATVLTSDDAVRAFQRFSTLDAVSNGRAEMIVGRGWFTESLALFGCDKADAERLFEDKLDLLATLIRNTSITWKGRHRPPLTRQMVFPPLDRDDARLWVAVGSTPDSVLRIACHNLPMMVAAIGGPAKRFKPLVELYRLACSRVGRPPGAVGIHSGGYIAATDDQAREEVWPYYSAMRERIGSERGWPRYERENFETEISIGSLYVGSPETVAKRIVHALRTLEASRFDLRYSLGELPHPKMMHCIQLYGRSVIPLIRELMNQTPSDDSLTVLS